MKRRSAIESMGVGFAASILLDQPLQASALPQKRRFTLDLCPGRIGVNANQIQAIQMAQRFGFESVEPLGPELAKQNPQQLEALLGEMRQSGLVWGAAGLAVDFRKDEAVFQSGLKELDGIADGLKRASVTRVGTGISPSHNELTYLANFRQHGKRLRSIAQVLGERGLRLGLEYVGPKTSWTARRYAFVHTLAEMRELLAEIDQPNVGIVLDSWHWYTAGETIDALKSLSNQEVVAVDLNDAPAGIAVDKQVDNQRALPTTTGVIDLKAFLGILVDMGYDGPVRAEPFDQALNAQDDTAALERTAATMKRAFSLLDA